MSARHRFLALTLGVLACADPVVYGRVHPGPVADASGLEMQPSTLSIRGEAGRQHVLPLTLRSDRPLLVDGIVWDGDETWLVEVEAPSVPIQVQGEVELQLLVRTGIPTSGGKLVFWGRDRELGRLSVERWTAPSIELRPRAPRGVGVVGTRLRLPLSVRRRATEAAELRWRHVADESLLVKLPEPLHLDAIDQAKVELEVDALRSGSWRLGVGVLGPETEDWIEVELEFASLEDWRFTIMPEPEASSAWISDLRRFKTWSDKEETPPGRAGQMLVGPAETGTRLGVSYLEDCRAAPSGLLRELFGATLTTLVPGSAEWQRLVQEVCVDRGPLDLRWTLEQGDESQEGQTRLERRGDRVQIGRWNERTRRFEVAP